MTSSDLETLLRSDIRELIEQNIDADHLRVALSLGEYGSVVATQIKYLQRARVKLPTYFASRCVIPPLAFEQSSSEAVASRKEYCGRFCVDLTCGLGVDSHAFSKRFDRVVSCEQDAVLAEVTKHNFGMMGVENIDLRCCTSEDLLSELVVEFPQKLPLKSPLGLVDESRSELATENGLVDLIYVDPARRSESGSKIFLLEDCSPNVVDMLPKISRIARKLVVKCSPLFDVSEAFSKFRSMMPSADRQITVEVVSLGGECKEVLIEVDFEQRNRKNIIRATAVGVDTVRFECEYNGCESPKVNVNSPWQMAAKEDKSATETDRLQFCTDLKFLLVPDVSLYKARLLEQYFSSKSVSVYVSSATGYCFSNDVPPDFMGKYYEIETIESYKPKELKRFFKKNGISAITIMKKDFPLSADRIAQELGVRQGAERTFVFTTINSMKYVVRLK